MYAYIQMEDVMSIPLYFYRIIIWNTFRSDNCDFIHDMHITIQHTTFSLCLISQQFYICTYTI